MQFYNVEKPNDLKVNINKWIYSEFLTKKDEIQKNIKGYRFDEAAKNAYQFVWHSFCDWYLEPVSYTHLTLPTKA